MSYPFFRWGEGKWEEEKKKIRILFRLAAKNEYWTDWLTDRVRMKIDFNHQIPFPLSNNTEIKESFYEKE